MSALDLSRRRDQKYICDNTAVLINIQKFTFKMRQVSLLKSLRKDSGLQTVCKHTCSGVTRVGTPSHTPPTRTTRDKINIKGGAHESFKGQQTKTDKDPLKRPKSHSRNPHPPPATSSIPPTAHITSSIPSTENFTCSTTS